MLLGIMWNSALGRQKNARQFRAEFFLGIVQIAKLIGVVERRPVKPRWMAGGVGNLMKCRPVIASRIVESVFRWQMNAVAGATVENPIRLIMVDRNAGIIENSLCRTDHLKRG